MLSIGFLSVERILVDFQEKSSACTLVFVQLPPFLLAHTPTLLFKWRVLILWPLVLCWLLFLITIRSPGKNIIHPDAAVKNAYWGYGKCALFNQGACAWIGSLSSYLCLFLFTLYQSVLAFLSSYCFQILIYFFSSMPDLETCFSGLLEHPYCLVC